MAARYTPPRSSGQRRAPRGDDAADDHENDTSRSVPQSLTDMSSENNPASHSNNHRPQPLPTPNKSSSPLPSNLLPSAPASPPTPAPSPTPHHTVSNWHSSLGGGAGSGDGHEVDEEDREAAVLLKAQMYFSSMGSAQKQKFLVDILNLCDNQQLSFISSFISPRLRKDPFLSFPNEICLRVRSVQLCNFELTLAHVAHLGPFFCRRPKDSRASLASIEKMARTTKRRYNLEAPVR